jgi:hypothetical protein
MSNTYNAGRRRSLLSLSLARSCASKDDDRHTAVVKVSTFKNSNKVCASNRTENKVCTKRASWFDAFSCSLAFPKRRQKEHKLE